MDNLIKEQLHKCKVAVVPFFDDNSTEILIPKYGESFIQEDIIINHRYKIEVEDYIINPYEGFTLHDNWNNGIIPKDKIMNCVILQVMGKMVRINAVGVNTNTSWVGWLPKKSFRVIKEIY